MSAFKTRLERPAWWRAAFLLAALILSGCAERDPVPERRISAGDEVVIAVRSGAPLSAWLSDGEVFWASREPITPEDARLRLDGSEAFIQLLQPAKAPQAVRRTFVAAGTGAMVLSQEGHVTAVIRFTGTPSVRRETLDDAPFNAQLYLPVPPPEEGAPAIVILPGSARTGLGAYARYLSSRGFAVALADFSDENGCWVQPGIGAVAELVRRVSTHPETAGTPILAGLSRGAEGAILTAARHSDSVRGVVTLAGFDHLLPAPRGEGCALWRAAWRIDGAPTAFIAPSEEARAAFKDALEAARAADSIFTQSALRARWVAEAAAPLRDSAALPYGSVDVPLLMIAGDEDGLWDAAAAARRAAERAPDGCAVIFDGAGHALLSMPWAMILDPVDVSDGVRRSTGGSAEVAWRAYPQVNTLITDFARDPSCPAMRLEIR